MIGPTRSAAVTPYLRLMGESVGTSYEQLAAIEGVVKGGEESRGGRWVSHGASRSRGSAGRPSESADVSRSTPGSGSKI
jgi:hypothetical protein